MGIFKAPSGDGTPNEKPYELRYEDGSVYMQRGAGRGVQQYFNLYEAILTAGAEAGHTGTLFVTDPETGTVLWTGQAVQR